MRMRLAFVGLAWVGAFSIVMALFAVLGRQLDELPVPLRALVISGVLVVSMTQIVIPLINRVLRLASRRAQSPRRSHVRGRGADSST